MGTAYAVTAAQDGCTIAVSGNADSPYASHTNVIDAAAANRQNRIAQRSSQLQAYFLAEQQAAGLHAGMANPAAANRTRFGHHAPPAPLGVADRNYTAESLNTLNPQLMAAGNPRTIKVACHDDLGRRGHSNYRYRVDPHTAALNPAASAMAQVVARRVGVNWTFYYQIWNPIMFQITKKDKLGKLTYRRSHQNALVNVVLAWGQLWPAYTTNYVVF